MLNWPGVEAVGGCELGLGEGQPVGRDARDFLPDRRSTLPGEAARGWSREGPMRDAHCMSAPPRIAATSSVRSIPTGHHVMHRPQPTQPDEPNWSSTWPACASAIAGSVPRSTCRTVPLFMYECSDVKQESQTWTRRTDASTRSVTSSTVLQKQVGQTIVQLPQARHRPATLFHCSCSRFLSKSSRSPEVSR